jgi:hypothetical protein
MGEFSSILLERDQSKIDRAKRLSDIVNSLVLIYPLEVLTRSWIAVRLSDGGTDGTLYDTRRDAVRHQAHETQCAYIQLTAVMGGIQLQEAYTYLKFQEYVYDNPNFRMTDPEAPNGGMDMQIPLTNEDVRSQIRRLHARRKAR